MREEDWTDEALDRCVEAVLVLAKEPLGVRDIEHVLIKVDRYADTFKVRDAVHRLVSAGRVVGDSWFRYRLPFKRSDA